MKVLITGGTGFVGSHLTEELVRRGWDVTVIDNGLLGDTENLENVEDGISYFRGDITDETDLEKVFTDFDVVFHLAAMSSSPQHQEKPVEGIRINVEGSYKVMEKCVEYGVPRFVYATTSSMYGSVEPPHSKGKGEEATNLYCASKMASEKYAEAVSKTSDLTCVGLRFFSIYGENERSKGGFANVISQFAWAMLNGESPTVYDDGSQRRDFIYVEDVVSALRLSSVSEIGEDSKIYDVGTGESHSMNDVVKEINNLIEEDVFPDYIESPVDNYVEETEADSSGIRRDLGWSAETGFGEGVEKVVKHYAP